MLEEGSITTKTEEIFPISTESLVEGITVGGVQSDMVGVLLKS